VAKIFENLEKDFINLIGRHNLFHAYLFFGEQTREIFEFAEKLANFLESGEFKKNDKFLNDLVVIKENENGNIGIDEIRNMQKFLYQSLIVSKKRTAIIYNAGALTDEAQSGILKIIEEPPKNSLIILVINRENLLLETLRSRMGKIYFSGEKIISKKGEEIDADETDIFFRKTIVDLSKNLSQNSDILKEILKRLSLMKQYNLNNKLQLRLLNLYLKSKELLKK